MYRYTLIAIVHCKAIFMTQRFWEFVHFYGFVISFIRKHKVDKGQGRKEGRILDDVQGGALCT